MDIMLVAVYCEEIIAGHTERPHFPLREKWGFGF
jgi:hypothetical protein